MEKTFRIVARIKNNLLIKAREELGYVSAAAAARAMSVSYTCLVEYESLKRSPWRKDDEDGIKWRPSALAIAAAYNREPEDLWPDAVREVKKTRVQMEVDAAPVGMLEPPASPEVLMLEAENSELVREALDSLSPKEKMVIEKRFGLGVDEEKTLLETGNDMKLSRERIRQIERLAFKKVREYVNSKASKEGEVWQCFHCLAWKSSLFKQYPVLDKLCCSLECCFASINVEKVDVLWNRSHKTEPEKVIGVLELHRRLFRMRQSDKREWDKLSDMSIAHSGEALGLFVKDAFLFAAAMQDIGCDVSIQLFR